MQPLVQGYHGFISDWCWLYALGKLAGLDSWWFLVRSVVPLSNPFPVSPQHRGLAFSVSTVVKTCGLWIWRHVKSHFSFKTCHRRSPKWQFFSGCVFITFSSVFLCVRKKAEEEELSNCGQLARITKPSHKVQLRQCPASCGASQVQKDAVKYRRFEVNGKLW